MGSTSRLHAPERARRSVRRRRPAGGRRSSASMVMMRPLLLLGAIPSAQVATEGSCNLPLKPLTNIKGANQPGMPVLTPNATACRDSECDLPAAASPPARPDPCSGRAGRTDAVRSSWLPQGAAP
jgi:hypothetical protein